MQSIVHTLLSNRRTKKITYKLCRKLFPGQLKKYSHTHEGITYELDLTQHLDKSLFSNKLDLYDLDYARSHFSGGVFFDVGSYFGLFSLNLAKQFPDSCFYAFEPNPYTYQVLCRNIQNNHIGNIKPQNIAFSGTEETREFRINNSGNRGASSFCLPAKYHHKDDEMINIHCVTLSSFIKKTEISGIDFMKIDVEGHELPVVNDLISNVPASVRPKHILLEEWGHSISTANTSSVELLIKNGYRLTDHKHDNFMFEKLGQ